MKDYFNFFKKDFEISIILIIGIITSSLFNIKWLLILLIMLFVILIWFYRSPIINLPYYAFQTNEIYSPSYGTIEKIEHLENKYKIYIKLELWDIHIQYFPVSGKVIEQNRTPKSVTTKMLNIMWDIPKEDREIIITQRTGYIARRIATPNHIGKNVYVGNELGIIKFGSHVDLFISDKYSLNINVGDSVYGPYTKIAEWKYNN
jgi:phosphatidylserine decarboxylase